MFADQKSVDDVIERMKAKEQSPNDPEE